MGETFWKNYKNLSLEPLFPNVKTLHPELPGIIS